ncbi:hypothetical protein A3F06_04005 [candidate division TM6 bacterium RIFCSPHIGHO2_12_FULL_36_22]|nr:MAG: hypothetical protein A3F06_04005 [candidate division TM6 bacterium RIFCSPHIGHO2_12_FULL_36_22]
MKKKNIVILFFVCAGVTSTCYIFASKTIDFSRQAARNIQGVKLEREPSIQTKLDLIKQGLRKFMVIFANPISKDVDVPTWKNIAVLINNQDIHHMTRGANSQHELYTYLKDAYEKINELRQLKVELLHLYKTRELKSKRDKLEEQMRTDTEEINNILGKIYGNGAPNISVPTTYSLLTSL